jgi:uncharacterized protein (TIGR02118 family)
MLKVFALIPSRDDITVEKFHSHWRDIHGPLATRITTIRGYIQSHAVREGPSGLPQAIYRGIAEVWFDDLDTALGMGADPDYVNGCGADESNFIDQSRLSFLFTNQEVPLGGPAMAPDSPETKAILLLDVGGDAGAWTPTAVVDHALALPGLSFLSVSVSDGVLRQDGQPFDAVVELSWPDVAGFDTAWAGAAGSAFLKALDESVDLSRSAAMLTQPLRVW